MPTPEDLFLLNKAKWRSRRGMLELDLTLPPFANKYFLELPTSLRNCYLDLLEEDDWNIRDWLQSPETAPIKYVQIVNLVNNFLREKNTQN